MRLLWEPVDFHALLQFLSHPVHPLPLFARRRMGERIADAPGIGGAGWTELMQTIETHYGASASLLMADIAFWIEHARYCPRDGAPLTAVYERVERLADYFRSRLRTEGNDAKRAAWQAGHSQAMAVRDAVQALAPTRTDPPLLTGIDPPVTSPMDLGAS